MENLNILIATNFNSNEKEKIFTNKIKQHILTNDNYMVETLKMVESVSALLDELTQNIYQTVIVSETLADEKLEIEHLKSMPKTKGFHIIMILFPTETLPSEREKQLYDNGFYDCIYPHKFNMRLLDKLIKYGRTPSEARKYYELPKLKVDDSETEGITEQQNIGLEERIKKYEQNSQQVTIANTESATENSSLSNPTIRNFAANMQAIPSGIPISYVTNEHLPGSKIGTVEAVVTYIINEDTAVIQLKRKPEIPFTDINFAGTEVNVPYLRDSTSYPQHQATAPPPPQPYPGYMQPYQAYPNSYMAPQYPPQTYPPQQVYSPPQPYPVQTQNTPKQKKIHSLFRRNKDKE